MKRIFSLFFLMLFLFNLGGYYFVFWTMENQARRDLLDRLEASKYDDSELLVISIPMTMPYPVNQGEYEIIEGEFQHDGQFYKLVKQRYANDTLHIVSIKDRETTKIVNAVSDYTKVTNNLPVGSRQTMNFMSKIYKDYRFTEFLMLYHDRTLLFEKSYCTEGPASVTKPLFGVESPPPEMLS